MLDDGWIDPEPATERSSWIPLIDSESAWKTMRRRDPDLIDRLEGRASAEQPKKNGRRAVDEFDLSCLPKPVR